MIYLVRRAGQAVVVLVLAFTLAFILLTALPGDAVMARYGNPDLGLTPEQIDAIRERYGADRPVIVRYLEALLGFLRGDLGYSVQSGASVGDLIAVNLPPTLLLASLGLAVAVFLAVTIAFTATYGGWAWLRRFCQAIPPLFVSLPVFWIGIVFIQIFSFRLGLIPTIGASPVEELILPVATLAIPITAPLAQILIRSIDEVGQLPFVAVVRGRGASTSWILWRNVARNALLPTLTMAGVLFGELVGGAVVTETVFSRTGVGQITAQAVANRDTPVLLAVVVITTVTFVVINLIVDLLYPVLDARLRRQDAAGRRRSRGAWSTAQAAGTAIEASAGVEAAAGSDAAGSSHTKGGA